jgi:hypothetical protein
MPTEKSEYYEEAILGQTGEEEHPQPLVGESTGALKLIVVGIIAVFILYYYLNYLN